MSTAPPPPPPSSVATRIRLRQLLTSFVLGGFVAILLSELGVLDALGFNGSDPVTVAACALAGLALGLLQTGARVVLAITAVLFSAYLVVAHTRVVSRPASRWVRADLLPAKPLDAIVVLSGEVSPDSSINHAAVDRLLTGLALVKAGAAPRLITTRTEVEYRGRTLTSDADQLRLIRLAGVEGGWTVVDSVHSTRDEAVRIAQRLLPAGPRTIAVVTSPMHTRRACQVFEAVGFQVYCVPAREHGFDTWHPRSPADRLAASSDYLYERLGMVKYRWKGWLPARSAAAR